MSSVDALASLEWGLAVFAAATVNDDVGRSAELERRLTNLGTSRRLLDSIRRGAGRWSVSDDDRTDVIVAYAAKFSRSPASLSSRDTERLEAVGFTPRAIIELNSALSFANLAARATDGSL